MIGFHGCDKEVCHRLLNKPDNVKKSTESYDWLGHGFYVWENNIERAREWAEDKKKRGTLDQPAVIGVVYQLNYCMDLTDSAFIKVLTSYYDLMKGDLQRIGKTLPKNKDIPKSAHKDLVIRELDCAVIEFLHQKIEEEIDRSILKKGMPDIQPFDTVRGIFTEGGPAFDGAGVQKKNHIQVCIRNLNCIKGFFLPRKEVRFP